MKNLLGIGLICGCLFLTNPVQAVTLQQANGLNSSDNISVVTYDYLTQQYLNDIGIKILNANNIEKHIIFGPVKNNSDFALSNYTFWGIKDDVTSSNRTLFKNRKVEVSRELLNNATSDDEVAALMSHEIAHCLKSYTGMFRGSFHGFTYMLTAKKQNYNADIIAVELMVKAGYNPVALITILDKTAGQYRFDIGENALTTKRIRKINEYIKKYYPNYISDYTSNPYYKNAMLIIQPAGKNQNWKYYTKKIKK